MSRHLGSCRALETHDSACLLSSLCRPKLTLVAELVHPTLLLSSTVHYPFALRSTVATSPHSVSARLVLAFVLAHSLGQRKTPLCRLCCGRTAPRAVLCSCWLIAFADSPGAIAASALCALCVAFDLCCIPLVLCIISLTFFSCIV